MHWTEAGRVKITIKRNSPRGKGRILCFDRPVLQIQLTEYEAHMIAWHLDPKSISKKEEKELPK